MELESVQQKVSSLEQAAVRLGVDFETAVSWGVPEADGPQYGPRKAGLLILSGTGNAVEFKSVKQVRPRLKYIRRSRRGGR